MASSLSVRRLRSISSLFRAIMLSVCCVIVVRSQQEDEVHDSTIKSTDDILLSIFDATSGLRWTSGKDRQWLRSDNFCEYYGIICYDESAGDTLVGQIRTINLEDNHLVGTLSSVVFELPYLQVLVVGKNPNLKVDLQGMETADSLEELYISDTATDSLVGIGKAPALKILHMANLKLTGPFPPDLLEIETLESLFANYNSFSGPLPSNFGKWFNLKELYLYGSDFTGSIPPAIGDLKNLKTLSVGQNALDGGLPTELGLLVDLESLDIQAEADERKGSGISGSLLSFSELPLLKELYLQNQALSGSIPDNFLESVPPQSLLTIDLSGNVITGSIPASLFLKERVDLKLADNRINSIDVALCAQVPDWFGGDVGSYSDCDGLLCPQGTWAPEGRQTGSTTTCQVCSDALYWGATECGTTPSGDLSEAKLLNDFYKHLDGVHWISSDSWLDESTSVCDWYGIDCNAEGKVSSIRLRNNGLVGQPPTSIFSLPELTTLGLSANEITFSFDDIEKATKLELLDLSHCSVKDLAGVGALASTSIQELLVASNDLVGDIPEEIYSISSLQVLDISHNRLEGSLTDGIGRLSNLSRLMCSGNLLSSSIPVQIGQLVNLVELSASENAFSGNLPTQLNLLTKLETLSLHQTTTASAITGALLSFSGLQQLTSLQLAGNNLSGDLPSDLLSDTRRASERIEVLLADNRFTGEVPSSWGTRFSQLALDLTGNRISGISNSLCSQSEWMDGLVGSLECDAILCPAGTFSDVGRKTSAMDICQDCPQNSYLGSKTCGSNAGNAEIDLLEEFFASLNGNSWAENTDWTKTNDHCSWYGVGCNADGEVAKISLRNNTLTGIPPSSIFKLPSLRELDLSENQISFSFEGIEQATELSILILSYTNVNAISGLEKATQLEELHMTDNDLKGSFPAEILKLTNLRTLLLNFNQIEGEFPDGISALSNLEEFYIYGNRLEGALPASLGSLQKLRTLALAGNNFSGKLPPELNNLVNLELLSIQREGGTDSTVSGNIGVNQGFSKDDGPGLSGPLLAFDKLTKLKKLFLGVNSLSGEIPPNFLDGIEDKSAAVIVDLISNELTGAIPAGLSRFDSLTLFLADNQIRELPPGLCRQPNWMGGQVKSFDCNGILCPPGTASEYGRQADAGSLCIPCSSLQAAPFYGSFSCLSSSDQQALGEMGILENLYRFTRGDSWIRNDNWLNSDKSICSWFGVTCVSEDDETVESISLMRNGLVGIVPPTLLQLSNLKELNLASNNVRFMFSGGASATALEFINLDSTSLTTLSGVDTIPNLKLLHIMDNDFGGQFPTELISMPNLEVLYLSNNAIGSIPASIQSMTSLVLFACSQCGLQGLLPTGFGGIPSLEYLRLDQNAFTGVLPPEYNSLVKLKHLDLSDQVSTGQRGIAGNLTSFVGFADLVELYLNKNQFEGEIPSDFLQNVVTTEKITIDLRDNFLTGSVPESLARFADADVFLANNQFSGIADALCPLQWNGKLDSTDNCDHILCASGSFNGIGRAETQTPCVACPEGAPFFGSTSCGGNFEAQLLTDIYKTLGGPNWIHNDGWTTSGDHCTWYGVTCHGEGLPIAGSVKSIKLPGNNLVGTLDRTVWRLTHMVELNLRENEIDVQFTGMSDAAFLQNLDLSHTQVQSLDGIGAANSLKTLDLANNFIEGPLPIELFNLALIEVLVLNFNRFSGPIPAAAWNLNKLEELYLYSNRITGVVPGFLSQLPELRVLSLGNNDFHGELDGAFSYMPKLEVISLQQEEEPPPASGFGIISNVLTGTVPSFHACPNLREVYLSHNGIGGSIPSDFLLGVNDKTATIRVDLTHNRVSGSIPERLTAFSDLRLLVAQNQIVSVPTEICAEVEWMNGLMATGCDALLCPPRTFNAYGRRTASDDCEPCDHEGVATYFGSTICLAILPGTLSEREILEDIWTAARGSEWTDSSSWNSDTVSICKWKGVSCKDGQDATGTVVGLDLSSNNLKGDIPSIAFYLPFLKVLNIENNDVSLSFRDIRDAQTLEEIYIGSTAVKSIEGIGKATNLRILHMGRTPFFGKDIPVEITSLTALESLDISHCGFSGEIPTGIGYLPRLEHFFASHNELNGVIPDSMMELSGLKSLSLSENSIYGTLESLTVLTALETLHIASRTRNIAGVSGAMPSFERATSLREIDLGSNSLTGTIPPTLLAGVTDKTSRISVILESNLLHGELPSSLFSFDRLSIDVSGNEISDVDVTLCTKSRWWDGDVGLYQCSAIACSPGFYNEVGRQTSETRCQECPGEEASPYYGSRTCAFLQKEGAKEILESFYRETGGSGWKRSDGWMNSNIDICEWYGITCGDGHSIESIIMGSNNLVGTPPKEIFELPGLKFLWLYSNPMTFKFDGIENAVDLTSLQLDSTGLTSLAGIGNAPALVDINIRFNDLSGPFSSEILKLKNLETLFIDNNELTGSLPSFESNVKLVQLRAGNNDLSGTLPSFSTHVGLTTLDLSNNQIRGEIPANFLESANTANPIFLGLSGNLLVGTVPSFLKRFTDLTLYLKDNRIDGIAQDLCGQLKWNGGDIGVFGCQGILCSPGTYSPIGRASQDDYDCMRCGSGAEFYGASECGGVASSSNRLLLACSAVALQVSLLLTLLL